MPSFWRNLGRTNLRSYDLNRLIDCRNRFEFPSACSALHIICDIDKTYLETKFESLLNILQVAFQSAEDKETVQGAAQVLLAARWGDLNASDAESVHLPHGLHFISSSPPQLRSVLEEKLMLDGLDWNSDTFKNQAYNLMKGRVSLLRQHIPYKSAAILQRIAKLDPGSDLVLIGDNAESDAFIYLGVTLFLRGKLSPDSYGDYFRLAGVDEDLVQLFVASLPPNLKAQVRGILIRKAPGYQFHPQPPLTDGMRHFDHFYQAALILCALEVIPASLLLQLTRQFHNRFGLRRTTLASSLTAARRSARNDLAATIDSCLTTLNAVEPLPPLKDTSADLSACDFSYLDKLSGEEILNYTRRWFQDLNHDHETLPTK